MTLDERPSDAELLRRLAQKNASRRSETSKSAQPPQAILHHRGVALGPSSPLAQPARRSRRQMNDTEHAEQSAFMTWTREPEQLAVHPELWLFYAIPNFTIAIGSERIRLAIGARANEEGRRKGMLDTHLPVARGTWHSLFIEFKAEGGNPSAEQRDWIERLRAAGNRVEIASPRTPRRRSRSTTCPSLAPAHDFSRRAQRRLHPANAYAIPPAGQPVHHVPGQGDPSRRRVCAREAAHVPRESSRGAEKSTARRRSAVLRRANPWPRTPAV
jgi:hypothetical protein